MAELVRVQLDLPQEHVTAMEELMSETGTLTRKDYINNALSLLELAIREMQSGRQLGTFDEKAGVFRPVVMPILMQAARRAAKKSDRHALG